MDEVSTAAHITPAETDRVRFGPRPDDTIPASWAAAMLQDWRRSNQNAFGKALQRAALGTDD